MKRNNIFDRFNSHNNPNYSPRPQYFSPAVSPEVLVNSLWLSNEPSGVQIIELNSSDENKDEDKIFDRMPNKDQRNIEDSYSSNRNARERRRRNDNLLFSHNGSTSVNNSKLDFLYDSCANICGDHNDINNDKLNFNKKTNFFTTPNYRNHNVYSDSSSEDDYRDVEYANSNYISPNDTQWDPDHINVEEFTHDPNADSEARTIWIYSFKNRYLLTDDRYEINAPTNDSSNSTTSSSIESDNVLTKDKSIHVNRVASPIPATYIPRLNLSLVQTLSTVTEISEINKLPSSNECSDTMLQKPKNNWLSEKEKTESMNIKYDNKSTNIVNWLALSPREKRRRSKNTEDRFDGSNLILESVCDDKLKENYVKEFVEKENCIQEFVEKENDVQKFVEKENDVQKFVEKENDVQKFVEKVDVEIHVSINEGSIKSTSVQTLNKLIDKSPGTDNNVARHLEAIYGENNAQITCDYDNTPKSMRNAPRIKLHSKRSRNTEISDPLENLESEKWIQESKEEKEISTYLYIFPDAPTIDKLTVTDPEPYDKFWIENSAQFVKAPVWEEYLPIVEEDEDNLSLHLSLGSILDDRKPWYIRFIKQILCCR